MKKLTKDQWVQITEAMDACNKQGDQLHAAVHAYNETVDRARADLGNCLNSYNESVAALREIYNDLSGQAQEYYEERSEAWQDSDAGTTYAEWIEQLADVDGLDGVDLELPEDIEEPDLPDFTDTTWLPPEAPGE